MERLVKWPSMAWGRVGKNFKKEQWGELLIIGPFQVLLESKVRTEVPPAKGKENFSIKEIKTRQKEKETRGEKSPPAGKQKEEKIR